MPDICLLGTISIFTHRQKDLTKRLIGVVHSACDVGDLDTALELLRVIDSLLNTRSSMIVARRQLADHIIMTHERVWLLRHSQT